MDTSVTTAVTSERYAPSHSGAEPYRMVRMPAGWRHADERCAAAINGQQCHHIKECEMSEETGLVPVQGNPLALLDAIDLDDILGHRLPVPVRRENGQHPWVYEFTQAGQKVVGVSIDGVNDAARALASKGETIRELWVRMEREDEQNAYFLACAARYAITPDGVEICLDTVIRAKRQPKFTKLRAGGVMPNENWYEVGVAKAVRNAKEALLPEAVKQWLIQQAQSCGAPPAPGNPRQLTDDDRYRHAAFANASQAQKLRLSVELQAAKVAPSTAGICAALGLSMMPAGMTIGEILDTIAARQKFLQQESPIEGEIVEPEDG